MDENKVTYFAQTDSRNKKVPFGIKKKDRNRHVYVIGKTGMGKSTLLENMAVQDIQSGEGLCFIDPHGKTAELLLEYIPESRKKDVLYFAPFDLEHPVSFNVMEDVGYDKRFLVLSGLMSTFKKIWEDAWSARMEYILGNTVLALLEYPGATLLSVNRMLADKEYRRRVVDNVTDPAVKSFWVDEFAKYTDKFAAEATPAIQNKIGQFTANPLIRNIIGQPTSSFDLRKIMDERKILIVNLSKGRVGESNANLLGSMIITKLYLAAMSRADASPGELKKLPEFYLYVDEFQSFANKSFADILSEARKYKLNLTIAHQYIEQMEEEVRAAVFGNVGTMITFRVGAYDADVLEKEFAPKFLAEDLVNLGFVQIYLKLMIDGISSAPFSATTLPPIKPPEKSLRDEVVKFSREQFAQSRAKVEEDIRQWHQPLKPEPKPSVPASSQVQPLAPSRPPQNFQTTQIPRSPVVEKVVAPVPASVLVQEKSTKVVMPAPVPTQKPQAQYFSTKPQAPVVPPIPSPMKSQSPAHNPPVKPISLQHLKNPTHQDMKKPPLKENISALRQALSVAMKDSQKKDTPHVKNAQNIPNTPSAPSAPHIQKNQGTPEVSMKEKNTEVSEDVLKKVLELN